MPMLNIVVQAALLSVLSNVIAQLDTARRSSQSISLTSLHITPILQFVVYAVLNTPINVKWQDWLESTFPTRETVSVVRPADKKNDKPASVERVEQRSVKNAVIKILMDQTIGAAFNIPLFIGIMGLLKGQSFGEITSQIQQDFLTIYITGMGIWLPVSILSFNVIPAQHRVMFGSVMGVVWNIYLGIMAGKQEAQSKSAKTVPHKEL